MELTKQKNYQQAFELASASLKALDLREKALKAGATHQGGETGEELAIEFFSESYRIRFPDVQFRSPSGGAVSVISRAIILHYLIKADGAPVTGQWVAYKDIPGAMNYASVFARRVTEPLVKRFGNSARAFMDIGAKSGGRPAGIGDASLLFQAFPRVPLEYVLWQGDDEFPPTLQLLFDSSVDHYLSLEDIVVIGQLATNRLVHSS
jgi:hypothetical protein